MPTLSWYWSGAENLYVSVPYPPLSPYVMIQHDGLLNLNGEKARTHFYGHPI